MLEGTDFDFDSRLIEPQYSDDDSDVEVSLRPKTLEEYVGQDKIKENLKKKYVEVLKAAKNSN